MFMLEKTTMLDQILDSAQQLVQSSGFHAFSYADISAEVGIQKASIHHYFPRKSDLGKEMVSRYREDFRLRRARIELLTPEPGEQLQRYAQIFRDMLRGAVRGENDCICLCGALSAEWHGLPESVQSEVTLFFHENEEWLAHILDTGRLSGSLRFEGLALLQAQAYLAGLEGAMQSARVHQDVSLYCAVAHQLLAQLGLDTLDLTTLDLRVPVHKH